MEWELTEDEKSYNLLDYRNANLNWGFQVAQWQRICLPMQEMQETQIQSLGQEDTLEKEMATHSGPLQYSCLENPMDRGAW